jgi:hypothetical protein
MKLSTLITMAVAMPVAFFTYELLMSRNWRNAMDASLAAWLTIGFAFALDASP